MLLKKCSLLFPQAKEKILYHRPARYRQTNSDLSLVFRSERVTMFCKGAGVGRIVKSNSELMERVRNMAGRKVLLIIRGRGRR